MSSAPFCPKSGKILTGAGIWVDFPTLERCARRGLAADLGRAGRAQKMSPPAGADGDLRNSIADGGRA
jgi:hypothetical protein